MCFLSIPHTVVGPVYIVWPLLTGSCFKQVILYRLSATGTSSSDHNSQVAALNSDQYRWVPLYIIHAATYHPHRYSVPHIFTLFPPTHSLLTTHTLSSHRHMNRYPPCGKVESLCKKLDGPSANSPMSYLQPLQLCQLRDTGRSCGLIRLYQAMQECFLIF